MVMSRRQITISSFSKIAQHSQKKPFNLPTDEELEQFTQFLDNSSLTTSDENGQKFLTFDGFMSIADQIPKKIVDLLQPATFFLAHSTEWPPPDDLRVANDTIIEFVSLKTAYTRNLIAMAKYNKDGTGTLSREQFVEYYRNEVMPSVDVLKELEESFEICYINTVESVCFFFLDSKHWGKIRMADLLVSGFLENAFGLQNNYEDYENWFSPEKTHEMNSLFHMFDSRQKNFLDKEDFKRVQNGSFTPTFIDSLFETHVSNKGENMSYEEFVVFQIAYSHLAHPSALAYFFKILDVNSDGFITNYEFHYFYSELRLAYNGWFMDGAMPEFDDFADQFYDMVKPVVNKKITLRELIDCKQGHDFVLCMISHIEFYRYEMRESENGGQDSEMPSYCLEEPLDEPEIADENSVSEKVVLEE